MRKVPLNRALVVFWSELVYVESAVLALEETAPLAAPVSKLLDEFEVIQGLDLRSRRVLVQSQARAGVADLGLDEGLRDLHSDALALVRQDRSDRRFRALFKSGIAGTIRHALKRQIEVTGEIVAALALDVFSEDFRAKFVPKLQPLVETGRKALGERDAARVERVKARLDIETWKEEVNALRLGVYSELLRIAATQHRPRSWADAFFPEPGGADHGDAAPAEPAPPVESPVEA